MSDLPQDLNYTKAHEWIRIDENTGEATIGITDHAQESLGDLVFVELPEVGKIFLAGDDCAVVESVKAASDIYAPLSGEVLAVNEALSDTPEVINDDPYGDGWMFKLNMDEESERANLLDAAAYTAFIESEDH